MKQIICEFLQQWFCESPKETFEIKDARVTTILDNHDESKKTVVIVDDNLVITEFVAEDFDNNLFNVIKITGKDAYNDIYTIMNSNIIVDYLITDLSLNTRYFNGRNVFEFDGIDVLIMFVRRFENIKYVIYTGMSMNIINDFFYDLGKKYKEYFESDIEEVIVGKSEKRINFSEYFTN